MTTFKRYEMISVTRCGEGWQELQEEPEGDWMRYEDCEALTRQNEALREALLDARATLDGIAQADWRKWEELAEIKQFELWAKSRAAYESKKIDAILSLLKVAK